MTIKTTLSLNMDSSLKERLQEVSHKSKISMAKIIDELLRENLSRYESKYMITPKLKLD